MNTKLEMANGTAPAVAQTSKSAVSRVSKPARRTISAAQPIRKSAIRQVWKPALRVAAILASILVIIVVVGCGKSDSSHAGQATAAGVAKYHCPMHPTSVSDRPGDCPICNMKLVPIGESKASGDMPSLPGRVTIHLDPEKRQLIGLTTSLVQTQRFARTIRASAVLSHDETTLTRVAPRFGGWVRKLNVNYTGQSVEAGAPLFTVYSPELFSAESDYLIAFRNARRQTNSLEAGKMLDGSRHRLELMQVGTEEIRALEERNSAGDELTFRAPASGHVIAKSAVEGKAFMAGESLYEIAPLHRLWVRAAVPEFELNDVREGQKVRVIFPSLEQKTIESTVAFINPHVDPQTRRGEVRIEVENPDHVLRPDMWAEVEIEQSLGDVLSVPASAVIDTGSRNVAFVDRDDGHLEPREVKVGAKTDDYWQVLDGLKAGEKVVTRALFLVDSESQLKAAIAGMGASGGHEH
jgi:Cu(I)/Ag(I) efflux system membrane fusion protein